MSEKYNDIRMNIQVLPADEPKEIKLGWSVYESVDGSMPDGSHIDDLFQPEKCFGTDLADQYLENGINKLFKIETTGRMSIRVLEFLNGKPWDNMALNFIEALRPSNIRVSAGTTTCDAYTWRVTVMLEKDNRTIKYISQEVSVGLHGIRYGHDASLYMRGQPIPKHIPDVIINPRGIKR